MVQLCRILILFTSIFLVCFTNVAFSQDGKGQDMPIHEIVDPLLYQSYDSINRVEGWDGTLIEVEGVKRDIRIFQNKLNSRPEIIIYMQDGQAAYEFFEALEFYINKKDIDFPSYAIVGIFSSADRMGEYLNRSGNNEAFKRYSQLFREKIAPRIEQTLNPDTTVTSKQRVLAGFSNGGAWSMSYALENPSFANFVLALSPGGPVPSPVNEEMFTQSKFIVGYGIEEGAFSSHARRIADSLKSSNINVNMIAAKGGHDTSSWVPIFISAIVNEFKG